MILTLGMGESSYVPDALVGAARDVIDVKLIAFLQCYAQELIHSKLFVFFSTHENWSSCETLGAELAEPPGVVMHKLERLLDINLVEERVLVTGPTYRITQNPDLRKAVLSLGGELPRAAWWSM